MRLWALAVLCVAAFPLSAISAEPRKGEFLQDYVTCELWMKRASTDEQMHTAISQWVVDALRQHSPSRLSQYGDGEIIIAVERHCQAQPKHTLAVATFLAGLRLPE
ncbi:hypothetical protein AB4Z10_20510 [Bosea sp. RAF48]|jgi:hypothetical protein|uniref:hypothetical protein n=1 Tax=Bosea sp. RAF48 TaxID=3237480 RepID=UPI003F922B8A